MLALPRSVWGVPSAHPLHFAVAGHSGEPRSVAAKSTEYTFARKRSYKRAVRRAAQDQAQHTVYRGRVCTLQQLCRGYRGHRPAPTAERRMQQAALKVSQGRLLFLSWNAGGLSQALWQEFLLTLENMQPEERPQIVCVQETHWTDKVAPQFPTATWDVYTSPTTDNKSAGLLILLNKQTSRNCRIVYADPQPGRVQHLRILHDQWAVDVLHIYLPGRNAAQAIHRVAAHCKYVQDRCSISTPTVVDRHAQQPKPCPHFAGAQLSLDLSSAFDLMDWHLLDKALLASEVPAELRHQIMSWHSEISYVLTHLGHTAKVEAQRGLRQGCKLAPLLWTLALAQIYRELLAEGDSLLTAPWLEQSSTIYADDIHLKDTMQNTRELDDMVYRFSKMLDALAAHGMVINSAKSALLLRHKGSFIKGWLRRHLKHTPEGDLLRFRSPLGKVYEIPLRDHHTYLGIRISYHSQAKQAVTYRLQAANQAWQRLRGVLCSTRHLAQTHRLSLWKFTLLPTLLYGIAASNPGAKDIQRMQQMMTKQVRAITRSFAHLQKESTHDLLHRCSPQYWSISSGKWKQLETLLLRSTYKYNANGRYLKVTMRASPNLLSTSARNVTGSLLPFGFYALTRLNGMDLTHQLLSPCLLIGMLMEQKVFLRADTVPIPSDNGMDLSNTSNEIGARYSVDSRHNLPMMPNPRFRDQLNQASPQETHILQEDKQHIMTLTADPMELDEQERQFWAQAGPVKREQEPRRDMLQPAEQSKRQRLAPQDRNKGKGKGTKGKGKGKQGLPSPTSAHPAMGYTNGFGSHPPNPWTQTQDLQPLGSPDPEWMEHRMNRLTQLVLRQEQIISAIRQDLVLYLFVRSGPEGMVPVLCDAAEKWRKMKEEEPEKITYSLKLMLFKQLLITLHQRLTTMIADEDALAKAKTLNWIDDQKHWKHLTWNPSKQCLEVDNSVRPIPAEDLLAQLVQMRKAVTEETLVRFKSMRKLTTEVTSDWIQFQICLSLRPEGGAMWSTLNQWIGAPFGTVAYAAASLVLAYWVQWWLGGQKLCPCLELQEAIDGWSAQVTARYALLTPSWLLCIQLQRFTNAEGDMRRDTRPMVMASTTVRMPIFAGLSTMQVRYVHYQVVAVQLHYGEKTDQAPIKTTELQNHLNLLEQNIPKEGVILNFRCTKNMEEEIQGEVLPFMATVGLRAPDADATYRALKALSGCTVRKLIGTRIRPERLARQPVAKQLEENYLATSYCPWTRRLPMARVTNRHNYCYANAVAQAIYWMGEMSCNPAMAHGGADGSFTVLGRSGKVSLVDSLVWRALLRQWPRPLEQHDAGEFMNHAIRLLSLWATQYSVRALQAHSGMVIFRLLRYDMEGVASTKNQAPVYVQPSELVALPVFESEADVSVRHEAFRVLFQVFHLGQEVTSGHYQCAVCVPSEADPAGKPDPPIYVR
ncbi:unnamed protein product [Symbiodinium sp. CCMP2592]|nr:unnamed protein product [Symbiodinium sp. CCMP2592]